MKGYGTIEIQDVCGAGYAAGLRPVLDPPARSPVWAANGEYARPGRGHTRADGIVKSAGTQVRTAQNRVVLTVTRNVPHQDMYFIDNVAEYQPAKAGDCSGQMLIKSVKIWKG